ncbi:cache domain-containing sensor histidine kinase [Paenibacillus alkalitolerans]|uniref:cache domain-containing sensor histidine kinase n=1 Tax=Paenibacillus alkalitolerans TaxID=2799335 RepID=UPI0018F770A0|nr:histidine kinase [Paenibacillus alkalitolerans]
MRFLEKWSLSVVSKFVLTFLSILTASMALMGMILYYQASHAAIEQGRILMNQNVQQIKNNILQKVNMVQNVSQVIAFDPKIQSFLGNAFLNEPYQLEEYRDTIAPILDNLRRQNTYIHSIRIYMANDSIPELYDGFYHMTRLSANLRYAPFINDPRLTSAWHGLHQEQAVIVLPGSSPNANVFSYNRKIFSSKYTDMVGMIEIEVERNVLFESLHTSAAPYSGDIYIVDQGGHVVSETRRPDAGQSLRALGLRNVPSEGNMNEVTDVNGVRSIVISTPLEGPGLRVVGVFPVRPFISAMEHSQIRIFGVLAAALALLSVIVYFMTNALLRRMKVLLSAMKSVREGNLNVSVPVVSNDEFAQMSMSFNLMTGRIHDLVETVYKSRILEKEAELRALESHINPHFLYNTLATIAWVGRKAKSPEVVRLANSLAKFYRLVLNKGDSSILVQDEVEMVRVYADIQKFRFEGLFDIVFDVDEALLLYRIPKNILQPLVENALTHGIEPKRGHGTIILRMRMDTAGDGVVLQVIDDGVGMDEERVQALLGGQIKSTSGSGYAVKNIIERLNGYYEHRAAFDVFSRPGVGTVVTIKLPKE